MSSEPDACSDKTDICEDPKKFSCSFKGCNSLPPPQRNVVHISTTGGVMKSSTVSAVCDDGDVYTTLTHYDSDQQILAVNIPEFVAEEPPDSQYCLDDSCLPSQGYNWTSIGLGDFTITGCRKDRHGLWCAKSNKLDWNGTNLLYDEPPKQTDPNNPYWAKCTKKDKKCKAAPQYCPAAECISDNIEWEEPALANVKHTGCAYVEGDRYLQILEILKQKCLRSNNKTV